MAWVLGQDQGLDPLRVSCTGACRRSRAMHQDTWPHPRASSSTGLHPGCQPGFADPGQLHGLLFEGCPDTSGCACTSSETARVSSRGRMSPRGRLQGRPTGCQAIRPLRCTPTQGSPLTCTRSAPPTRARGSSDSPPWPGSQRPWLTTATGTGNPSGSAWGSGSWWTASPGLPGTCAQSLLSVPASTSLEGWRPLPDPDHHGVSPDRRLHGAVCRPVWNWPWRNHQGSCSREEEPMKNARVCSLCVVSALLLPDQPGSPLREYPWMPTPITCAFNDAAEVPCCR